MKEDRVRLALQELFGPQVGIGVTDPRSDNYLLMDSEKEAVARAVPKRLREFSAGRAAGREALSEIGFRRSAITRSRDRTPVWPAGIVGSISHCDSLCLAAVCHIKTWRSIGLDIEGDAPLQKEAWPIILTQQEEQDLKKVPRWRRARRIKALFSIKEAVYKAQYPLTGEICDFHTLNVTIDGNRFEAMFLQDVGSFQTGFVATGGFAEVDRYVVSCCMMEDR